MKDGFQAQKQVHNEHNTLCHKLFTAPPLLMVPKTQVIPTTLSKLLLMSQYEQSLLAQDNSLDPSRLCGACGKKADVDTVGGVERVLARCKGCQGVWYCDKASLPPECSIFDLILRREEKRRSNKMLHNKKADSYHIDMSSERLE
jgi:hypothetical protein